jgi:hypothetical protein
MAKDTENLGASVRQASSQAVVFSNFSSLPPQQGWTRTSPSCGGERRYTMPTFRDYPRPRRCWRLRVLIICHSNGPLPAHRNPWAGNQCNGCNGCKGYGTRLDPRIVFVLSVSVSPQGGGRNIQRRPSDGRVGGEQAGLEIRGGVPGNPARVTGRGRPGAANQEAGPGIRDT